MEKVIGYEFNDGSFFADVNDAVEYIIENGDFWEEYDEMLNECNDDFEVGSMSYTASYTLEQVDPIAYNCGYSDFTDSITESVYDNLTELDADESYETGGFTITYVEK